jgi:secreted Zn-dependent insulinase-like peptidase
VSEVDSDKAIKTLLVSDPETEMSACAFNISVGTLKDPKSKQGLAHLLEHMTFLDENKTENTSEGDSFECPNFKEWIEKNGGYCNAFTSLEATNYSF